MVGAGADVVGLARSEADLRSLQGEVGERLSTRVADAAEGSVAEEVLSSCRPDAVVMVAGAAPEMKPLRDYDWDALSRPWQVDVQAAFRWLQAALRTSMSGRFVLVSSGAALHGSPLSGGYAGAKQTQRFLAKYAAGEARAAGQDLQIQTVLPQLNPNTALGRAGIAAYAAKAGVSPEAFAAKRFGPQPLNPEIAGQSLVALLTEAEYRDTPEFVLTGGGLRPVPA
jgi:NADP-dependent 3-hydroxy acid dehydrogenase YdfG